MIEQIIVLSQKAINGIKILKRHNVPVGGMATISKCNIKYRKEIYTFFKQNELPFQFNPLFYSGNANENLNSLSISPEEYAKI